MPLLSIVWNDMSDIDEAILSVATISFRADMVTDGSCCVRVSSNGDTAAKRDIRIIAVIAGAKVRRNCKGF